MPPPPVDIHHRPRSPRDLNRSILRGAHQWGLGDHVPHRIPKHKVRPAYVKLQPVQLHLQDRFFPLTTAAGNRLPFRNCTATSVSPRTAISTAVSPLPAALAAVSRPPAVPTRIARYRKNGMITIGIRTPYQSRTIRSGDRMPISSCTIRVVRKQQAAPTARIHPHRLCRRSRNRTSE